ncbi:MAG: FtsX-like permease family protein [Bdellovibrionota bacterium]
MILKLAFLELWRSRRWTILFILNLSLGIVGFLTLTAYRENLNDQMTANAKNLLSADIAVSGRKEIPDDTLTLVRSSLPTPYKESVLYDFFAMMTFKETSRLVLVKAIDDNYPFYGYLELDKTRQLSETSPKKELKENGIYLYPELSEMMGIKNNDEVTIGNLKLKAKAFVTKDNSQTFRMALLAPRVYIHRDLLPNSGLIQTGSTFTKAYLFKLDTSSDQVSNLRQKLLKDVKDPGFQIQSPATAGEDSARQLNYLSDFLGLVAVVALLLSALGASYLFRLFFSQQLKDISIYRILGFGSLQIHILLAWQALMLSFCSLVLGTAAAFAFTPILNKVLSQISTVDLTPEIQAKSLVVGFLVSFFSSYFLILPHLTAILKTPLQRIFSGQLEELDYSWKSLSGLGLFLAFIYLLSVTQAQSFVVGNIFFGTLFASLVALYFIGYFILRSLRWVRTPNWKWSEVFHKISRQPKEYSVFFVTIGIGVLLINLIPQLRTILSQDLTISPNSPLPSAFMFDIQDEQKPPLEKFLTDKNLNYYFSPMVRGRIISVNGEAYERTEDNENAAFKTREEEEDARFRNRGVNLSYRPGLLPSESIVEGEEFPMQYSAEQKIAFLSLEEKYAKRLRLEIGDKMNFDVQGVPIEGEVKNFRRIKWTSFQPNFFVLIQQGLVDEAPKTYVASVSGLPSAEMTSFITSLSKTFTNISVIDVKRLIDDMLELLGKMSSALELMSVLALLVGAVVLFAIIRTHGSQRRRQINLLKILGARQGELQSIFLLEYAFISGLAAIFGILLSLFVSALLGIYVFKAPFALSWREPFGVFGLVLLFTAVMTFISTQQVIREKPQRILNEEN